MWKSLSGILVSLFTSSALFGISSTVNADEYVRGYTRKDGTYVQPHHRSDSDGNRYNNYSYPGNTNPYTGKRAMGDSDTYLQRQNRSNGQGLERDSYRSLYGR
jgi:hypothetical protein